MSLGQGMVQILAFLPFRGLILKMEPDVNYELGRGPVFFVREYLASSLYLGDPDTYLYFVEPFALPHLYSFFGCGFRLGIDPKKSKS